MWQCPHEVYLLKSGKYHKIGISVQAEVRAKNLIGAMPFRGSLLMIWKTQDRAQATETALHKIFKKYHRRGEWFVLPKELVAELTHTYNIEEWVAGGPTV